MSAPERTDEQVDRDLALEGFDAREEWPEYGHGSLRQAWRGGYESGYAQARSDLADELTKRGQQALVGLICDLTNPRSTP